MHAIMRDANKFARDPETIDPSLPCIHAAYSLQHSDARLILADPLDITLYLARARYNEDTEERREWEKTPSGFVPLYQIQVVIHVSKTLVTLGTLFQLHLDARISSRLSGAK